ncbi:7779_t:CDS:2, partial [Cetraspora pellucida]
LGIYVTPANTLMPFVDIKTEGQRGALTAALQRRSKFAPFSTLP